MKLFASMPHLFLSTQHSRPRADRVAKSLNEQRYASLHGFIYRNCRATNSRSLRASILSSLLVVLSLGVPATILRAEQILLSPYEVSIDLPPYMVPRSGISQNPNLLGFWQHSVTSYPTLNVVVTAERYDITRPLAAQANDIENAYHQVGWTDARVAEGSIHPLSIKGNPSADQELRPKAFSVPVSFKLDNTPMESRVLVVPFGDQLLTFTLMAPNDLLNDLNVLKQGLLKSITLPDATDTLNPAPKPVESENTWVLIGALLFGAILFLVLLDFLGPKRQKA